MTSYFAALNDDDYQIMIIFFNFQIATPGSIYKDVEPYKIRQKILLFLSPFCPSRLLYTELKVQAATVHEEMKALEEEGLGHVYTHGNKTVFAKKYAKNFACSAG